MSRVIYLAGPVTGVERYWDRFWSAEVALKGKGWICLDPARLPVGMERDRYMPICLAMLGAADAICLLDGWEDSPGAGVERGYAAYQGKTIYQGADSVPDVRGERNDRE